MQIILIVVVFVTTIALIIFRPGKISEAWAAVIGGMAMLLLHLETVREAVGVVAQGAGVLLFLIGLLVLSNLLRDAGFFDWAALHAIRAAGGSGQNLYRNVFILGALTTAFMSLDTTAVILTPVVLSFVRRLKLSAAPFVITCAFVANTASLLLPVSNLTNLLFFNAFHWRFGRFTEIMFLPQIVALIVNYLLFKKMFGKQIPIRIDNYELLTPGDVVPNVPFFRGAVAVLVFVLVGYFAGSIINVPPFVFAITGSAALYAWGAFLKQSTIRVLTEVSWPIFPFVIGLFVLVRGVENAGLTHVVSQLTTHLGHSEIVMALTTSFGAAVGSNVVNNIPMALLAVSALHTNSSEIARYGALLGCDLGPNLVVTGSLATILVINCARKQGQDITALDFLKTGSVATPLILVAAALTLAWYLAF